MAFENVNRFPEPVEGLPCFPFAKKEGQPPSTSLGTGFDKLREAELF
jgi:hypothetical protein